MKKFILLAVVAIMAVFACQKQDSFTPKTVKEGVVSSRSSVTPEELAQNENFKTFINNVFGYVKSRGAMVRDLSPSNLNILSNISTVNPSQVEIEEALNIFGETEETLINEVSLIAIPFNNVLNDFPDLRSKSKEELNNIVFKAGDLFIEEVAVWYRAAGGSVLADEIPDGYEHMIFFGCNFNWQLLNLDGTLYTCPNYETCYPVWSEAIGLLWEETLDDTWECVKDWISVSDWITYGGFLGGVLTAPAGGEGAIIGSVIGAVIGIAVNLPQADTCLKMVDETFDQECAAAIAAANACCEW